MAPTGAADTIVDGKIPQPCWPPCWRKSPTIVNRVTFRRTAVREIISREDLRRDAAPRGHRRFAASFRIKTNEEDGGKRISGLARGNDLKHPFAATISPLGSSMEAAGFEKAYICAARHPYGLESLPVKQELQSLRQFFLLRYHEEVRKTYPAFRNAFPLEIGSRLDIVHLNGSARVHFLYSRGDPGEHLVVLHGLTFEGDLSDEAAERAFVHRALGSRRILAHFILLPPYTHRFDQVEAEAVAAVQRHAKLRPSAG